MWVYETVKKCWKGNDTNEWQIDDTVIAQWKSITVQEILHVLVWTDVIIAYGLGPLYCNSFRYL